MKAKILIDWCTCRIRGNHNPENIIMDYLGMDPYLFTKQDFSPVPGYRKALVFGGIAVCYDSPAIVFAKDDPDADPEDPKVRTAEQMGVCVSMPGSGCRTFENTSVWKGEDFGAFCHLFKMCHIDPEVSFTRVDLALDDHAGILNMQDIIESAMHNDINTRVLKRSITLTYEGAKDRGRTIYIGSAASSFRTRIYDKAKEQYSPDEPEYLVPWIRVELVMRGKNANGFVGAYCNSENLGLLASGILNDHLSFIERIDSNTSRCPVSPWWLNFVESLEEVKLICGEQVQHTLDQVGEWLTYQIAPSLAMFYRAYGWTGLKKLLQFGEERQSAKHEAILQDFEKLRESLQHSSLNNLT